MDDSSVFQRRLAAALQTMDPAWRTAFIDYEKLRKQVKKIVFLQQQDTTHPANAQQLNSNASASSSANSSPALSSASSTASTPPATTASVTAAHHKQRTNKYHQQFHSSLQHEMQQMNGFFLSRTTACTKLFDELGLDHAAIQHQQVHPIATLTFAKVLLDTFPNNALLILNPLLVQQAGQTRMEVLEPRQIALFKRLLHLCYEIDQLRKYVLINHAILWKVIKKYDKHAGQDTQKSFLHMLNAYDFSGDKCSQLVQRAQYVSKRLLQQDVDERKGGTCPICLRAPMVDALSLSCSHAFCFTCLMHQPTFWQCCPICRREDDWDAHMLSVESVMSDSIVQSISTMKESASPLHARTPTATSSGASNASLSPSAVVATALNSSGVNGALQALPPFLQQALLSAVSSAAVAAVSAIKNGGGLAAAAAAQKGDQNNVIQAAVNAAIQAQMGQLTALASPKAHHSPNGRRSSDTLPCTPTSTTFSSASSVLSPTSNTSPVSVDDNNLSPSSFLQQLIKKARHVKSSQGVSCHQCKTTKQTFELHFCSSQALISRKGRRRKCRKKYCDTCLRRSYSPAVLEAAHKDARMWPCPSCLGLCICAACTRSGGQEDSDDDDTENDQMSVMSSETKRSFTKDGAAVAAVPGASPAAQRRQLQAQQQQRKRKELEMQSAIAQLTASGMLDQLTGHITTSPQSAMPHQQAVKTEQQLHLEEAAAMLGQQPRLKLSASSPSLSATLAALQHQQQQQQLMHNNHSNKASTSATSLSSSSSSSSSSSAPASSSSSPSPPSDTTPSQQQSDIPSLEVVSPPSSACSKASSQSNDNSDESDEQNNTVSSMSNSAAYHHSDPVAQVSDDMERSSKQAKRWQLDSPTAKGHTPHIMSRLSIPTSNGAGGIQSPMSPLSSPLSNFSPSTTTTKLENAKFGSSSALSTATNSPNASNASSPTHAAALMFAKSLRVQSDSSSSSSSPNSSSPASPSFSAGNSGVTTPTHGQHFPSPQLRRGNNAASNALLTAQAALNSRQIALKAQQLAQQQAQQQHAQAIYNKLRQQQPPPPSATVFAAASLHRNASVPTLSSPYAQQQQQQLQVNGSSRYSFPPVNSANMPPQHNLHPSLTAAPIPPLHAVSPLSSLPSPPTSAVSSPRSHMDQLPTGAGSFGATDEDGFDPLMTLDGDGAGNSGSGGYMFPPASPPPTTTFPYNQQPSASSTSSPFTHDSDLSLLHLGQQPNVRALNEHDAALPLSGGTGSGGGGSNPFSFGVHHGDGGGVSDKYSDMSSMFGNDYLDDTLM